MVSFRWSCWRWPVKGQTGRPPKYQVSHSFVGELHAQKCQVVYRTGASDFSLGAFLFHQSLLWPLWSPSWSLTLLLTGEGFPGLPGLFSLPLQRGCNHGNTQVITSPCIDFQRDLRKDSLMECVQSPFFWAWKT